MLCLRKNPPAQRYVARLAHKHGKGKALTILAHKLARAVYYMLRRGQAFEATKFFGRSGPGQRFARSAIEGIPSEEVYDASRAEPPRLDREGGRYVDPPEIARRGSRRRVHTGGAGASPRRAADAVERAPAQT